ncbi:MAG: phosphatidylcholine/phosphatidylserine synthase [Bdellovibrionales bacterium]
MTNEQETPPRHVVKDLPLTRLFPNMLTVFALCSGLTGMRFAMQGNFEFAVLAILIAAIFDVLDGRVARMLNIASKFGAELDSLSDAISFGVAPGFIMYEWVLKDGGGLGWIAVMVFAVCCSLRLARFNTMLDNHNTPFWAKRYFTGVPAPSGAALGLLPLAFFLEFGEAAHFPPFVYSLWMLLVGGLMVSRLPTFAPKGWRIEPLWVAPLFAGSAALVAGLITNTWMTLSVAGVFYVLAIPVSWYSYHARAKKEASL